MENFTISIIYNARPGFFIRIALVLERRGFELISLQSKTSDISKISDYSEMQLSVKGCENKIEQLLKQINKLIDVIAVEQIREHCISDFFERRMAI